MGAVSEDELRMALGLYGRTTGKVRNVLGIGTLWSPFVCVPWTYTAGPRPPASLLWLSLFVWRLACGASWKSNAPWRG
jgi:hypothetical protein